MRVRGLRGEDQPSEWVGTFLWLWSLTDRTGRGRQIHFICSEGDTLLLRFDIRTPGCMVFRLQDFTAGFSSSEAFRLGLGQEVSFHGSPV